jgi:hypothetical protein
VFNQSTEPRTHEHFSSLLLCARKVCAHVQSSAVMSQHQVLSAFWWLLLATLLAWQHAAAAAVQSRQCRVSSVHNVSLLDCLRDQTAEEILVEADPLVGGVASLKGAPLHLSRSEAAWSRSASSPGAARHSTPCDLSASPAGRFTQFLSMSPS